MRPASLLLILLLLASCNREQAASDASLDFTDDLGRSVTLEQPVNRVISLAPSLTEIIFAAGAGSKLVGVTTADFYPPAIDTLPRFTALPVDFEAIARLQPDLALATDQVNSPRVAETFEVLDIPVVFLAFPNLESIMEGIRKVGEILGTDTIARAAADSLEREIELIRTFTDMAEDRPLVLFLIGDETLYSFGDESYVHEVIRLAGGQSVMENIGATSPVLSDEYVLRAAPEVIFLPRDSTYNVSRLLELHPTWDTVPAIRDGRVYTIPPEYIELPGPRIMEGLRRMAEYLHPELFSPVQLAYHTESRRP
jgi:iron complex transport system substrate-binding protein